MEAELGGITPARVPGARRAPGRFPGADVDARLADADACADRHIEGFGEWIDHDEQPAIHTGFEGDDSQQGHGDARRVARKSRQRG